MALTCSPRDRPWSSIRFTFASDTMGCCSPHWHLPCQHSSDLAWLNCTYTLRPECRLRSSATSFRGTGPE